MTVVLVLLRGSMFSDRGPHQRSHIPSVEVARVGGQAGGGEDGEQQALLRASKS